MTTFVNVVARIADDLNRTDLTTQIQTAVNRAILNYEKEPFWFKETSGTLATVAGTASYGTADGLPSDIERIHFVEITVSSSDYPLTERDISWIQTMNPNASQGEPTDYAFWQSKLWLYLIPSAVRTIRIYYTKKYTALSGDSDTNDWTVYAEDLIESRARWWVNKRIIRDDVAAAEDKAEEMEALDALRSKNEDNSAGQGIQPSVF